MNSINTYRRIVTKVKNKENFSWKSFAKWLGAGKSFPEGLLGTCGAGSVASLKRKNASGALSRTDVRRGKEVLMVYHNFPPPTNHKDWFAKGEVILSHAFDLFKRHYKISDNTTVTVNLDRRIKKFYGECVRNSRIDYDITLASIVPDPEVTFWHELTHLVQYQTRKLYDIDNGSLVRYKGRIFMQLEVNTAGYNSQPWEAQANMVSGKLWSMYKEECLTIRRSRV